jgi:hypothetical protein
MTVKGKGDVVTFYSFKGGTGRSMMLANVAWIVASNGYRVLTIDWDLEAPGLHRYFRPFLLDQELSRSDGVIDFALDFCVAATMAEQNPSRFWPTSAEPTGQDPGWLNEYADIARYAVPLRWRFPDTGCIDFVGAGRQGASYSARVNGFSWRDFYEKFGGGGMLNRARALMVREYDFVFIDSRTGVSDTSGICTVHLPTTLVVCFTLNNQSIDGAAGVARSAMNQNESLEVLPVPMRIDNSEKDKLEARRDYAMARFELLLPGDSVGDQEDYWRDVEVPYVPFYAYEEILATFKDKPGSGLTVLSSAEHLASRIVGRPVRALRMPESSRQTILATYEGRVVEVPAAAADMDTTVYISYRRQDGMYAIRLFDRIAERLGTDRVLMDVEVLPGDDLLSATQNAIGTASVCLVVIGPGWGEGEPGGFQAQEVTAAVNLGRRIIPVLVGGATLPTPAELEKVGLGTLSRVQAAVLSDSTWQSDVDRLLAAVELASAHRVSQSQRATSRTSRASSTSAKSDEVIDEVLKTRSINRWSQVVAVAATVLAVVLTLILLL